MNKIIKFCHLPVYKEGEAKPADCLKMCLDLGKIFAICCGSLLLIISAWQTVIFLLNKSPQIEFGSLQGNIGGERCAGKAGSECWSTIPANADVGKLVAVVSVSDLGDHGRTRLRITQGNQDGLFSLDSTGDFHVLRTARKLNSETTHQYRITVEAEDSGTPPSTSRATLLVKVFGKILYFFSFVIKFEIIIFIGNHIELRGGDGVSYGDVFVLNPEGFFGPVCSDDWGVEEANAVCR